jgi:hypothetical protein
MLIPVDPPLKGATMRWTDALVLALLVVGCSDSTAPDNKMPGPVPFEGHFDAADGTFLLGRTQVVVPGGVSVPIKLIGSNLTVDSRTEQIEIDVALLNEGFRPLYPPAIVWVSDFVPNTVRVINANVALPVSGLDVWGFDYTELMGSNGILAAGATSESYRWRFHDPGLESFAFAVDVEMSTEPPPGFLAGGAFADENQDGIRQRNEGPWASGFMHLQRPDGSLDAAYCDENGEFRFIVRQPGLYQLRLESLVDCIMCFTTPNPLEVMIVEEPDGTLRSFEQAVFGAICGPCSGGE